MRILRTTLLYILLATIWIGIPNLLAPHVIEYVPIILKPQEVPKEELLLLNMTLEEKVGQLFLVGFQSTTLNENILDWIQNKHIGGVLLLGRNIEGEVQLRELNRQLQTYSSIPLFISIDQEGGIVSRLYWDSILTIAQKDMIDINQTYDIAKRRGEILKNIGINMNMAPVVENISNKESFMYKRVFRGTPQEIAEKAEASISGYVQSGIIPVPKHFPGHINTSQDSHKYLSKVDISQQQWDTYIYPFKYILESKLTDTLMIGHVLVSNIDSKVSTISTEIIQNRLRNQLNFEGVTISDDMEMKSIKTAGDDYTLAKEAILAGIDVLIYSSGSEKEKEIYQYILDQYKQGNMLIEDLDQKVLRILKVKSKYKLLDNITIQE